LTLGFVRARFMLYEIGAHNGDRIMRGGIVLAAALTVFSMACLSATGANADEWCGYTTHDNAVIECGYTTAADCANSVGKGGMCFVDPDIALNFTRAQQPISPKIPPKG
jgi:hypothetical protein